MKRYDSNMFLHPPQLRDTLQDYERLQEGLKYVELAWNELEADILSGEVTDLVYFGQDKFTRAPTDEVFRNMAAWHQFYESMLNGEKYGKEN